MIACAAVSSATCFEQYIFSANADEVLRLAVLWICGDEFRTANPQANRTISPRDHSARDHGFHSDSSGDGGMFRPGKHFLRRSSLQNGSSTHHNEAITQPEGVDPVMGYEDSRKAKGFQ